MRAWAWQCRIPDGPDGRYLDNLAARRASLTIGTTCGVRRVLCATLAQWGLVARLAATLTQCMWQATTTLALARLRAAWRMLASRCAAGAAVGARRVAACEHARQQRLHHALDRLAIAAQRSTASRFLASLEQRAEVESLSTEIASLGRSSSYAEIRPSSYAEFRPSSYAEIRSSSYAEIRSSSYAEIRPSSYAERGAERGLDEVGVLVEPPRANDPCALPSGAWRPSPLLPIPSCAWRPSPLLPIPMTMLTPCRFGSPAEAASAAATPCTVAESPGRRADEPQTSATHGATIADDVVPLGDDDVPSPPRLASPLYGEATSRIDERAAVTADHLASEPSHPAVDTRESRGAEASLHPSLVTDGRGAVKVAYSSDSNVDAFRAAMRARTPGTRPPTLMRGPQRFSSPSGVSPSAEWLRRVWQRAV